MNSIIAYILGIFTILIILVSYWYIATVNINVADSYLNTICHGLTSSDNVPVT